MVSISSDTPAGGSSEVSSHLSKRLQVVIAPIQARQLEGAGMPNSQEDILLGKQACMHNMCMVYLQVCNGMPHLWGSLLAEVDQADIACHMVPMLHGCAKDRVQF